MRLYPKKLRSIDDLEREKKLLRKECRRLDEEEFLSMEGLFDKKAGKGDKGGFSILDYIPVSNPVVDILVKFLKQKLAGKNNDPAPHNSYQRTEKKKSKNPLKSLAVEIIGGYLKWKAIELSAKGIRYLIKKRREKKAAEE